MGMVQLREDLGFNQQRFHVLGVGDSFRVWHLDGDRTVKVVVVSEIDTFESALTEPMDDPIAPNFGRISGGEVAQALNGRLRAGGSRLAPGVIRGVIRSSAPVWDGSVSDVFFVSPIVRSLTMIDCC